MPNFSLDDLLKIQDPTQFRMMGVQDAPQPDLDTPLQPAPPPAAAPTPTPALAATPQPGAMPSPAATSPAPATDTPSVTDYIKKKFNLGEYSDENRKTLVDKNAQYDFGDRASAALAALGAGLSGGNAASAGMNIRSADEAQKQKSLDAFDKGRANTIQNQQLDVQATDQANAEAKAQREMDPNSPESKLAQSLAKKMSPTTDFSSMSAQKINEQIPSLKTVYEGQVKLEEQRQKSLDRQHDNQIRASDKTTHEQDQANARITALLEQQRGSVAGQAEKDLYAGQKAAGLLKLYPNLNDMPQAQVNLLTQEFGKIASGGAPSMHETEGISSKNIQGPALALLQKIGNHPTGAQLGSFLKEMQKYGTTLSDDARKVIKDRYGRIIESNKGSLGDAHYKTLQDQYVNRFLNDDSTGGGGGGYPRTVTNPQTKQQATVNSDAEAKEAASHGFN